MGENEVSKDVCKLIHKQVDEKLIDIKGDMEKQDTTIDTVEKAVLLLTEYVKDAKEQKKEGRGWLYTVSGALVVNAIMMLIMLLKG